MATMISSSTQKPKVLFICTQNSARSQMAEGLLRAMAGDRYEVLSGGTQPTAVHPLAVRALGEIGIDISRQRAKNVAAFSGMPLDYVITVCDNARESCPFFEGGRQKLHRSFQDPAAGGGAAEEKLAAFRRVRDEIKVWLEVAFGAEKPASQA